MKNAVFHQGYGETKPIFVQAYIFGLLKVLNILILVLINAANVKPYTRQYERK